MSPRAGRSLSTFRSRWCAARDETRRDAVLTRAHPTRSLTSRLPSPPCQALVLTRDEQSTIFGGAATILGINEMLNAQV